MNNGFYNYFSLLFLLLLTLCAASVNAQFKNYKSNAPTEYDETVVDDTYGILIYEKLNKYLDGDSARMCGNYACNNWHEDKYKNGNIIHKGFYVNGQLRVYKNFYPDGTLEREFKNIDDYRAQLKLYHPNGKLKSDIKYLDKEPKEWKDYFPNGNLEYHEVLSNKLTWHTIKNSYYENGNPQIKQEVKDKKKLFFTRQEFYESGQLKIEGELRYDENMLDYIKVGKWKYFDESGNQIKEETYKENVLIASKDL
jgi:antitoxin component YwqK of YwqJK toxin-antitoxin module